MKSQQAQVAALCKKFIIAQGIKCSVRSESFAGGDSVSVEYTDTNPATHEAIEKELSQYQYGSFDGMQDLYEYTNTREDIPQTKYLSIRNDFSDELKQKAWVFIRATYADAQELAVNYADIGYNARVRGQYATEFMYRFLNGSMDKEYSQVFWKTVTRPKVKVNETVKQNVETVDSVTVSEGTKEGYVEVRFPAKPEAETITELKAAGFRWSRYNGCWWGKANKLPEAYQGLI